MAHHENVRHAMPSGTPGKPEASEEPRRSRGRPRLRAEAETRKLIVAAAAQEFLERGYGGTSIDAVARRAGASKKTIYCCVATKADLLAALITEKRESLFLSIDMDKVNGLALDAALEYVLGKYAHLILSEQSVALYRLLMAESPRFPELASTFDREGPARGIGLLAGLLEQWRDRGLLKIEDVRTAAGMLLSMVIAEPQRLAAFGLGGLPENEIATRVKTAVALFLRGCLSDARRRP
jgi:TetR/AcrR family transcriptional regulator, mexJK operon transcriptional repressor